MRQMFYYCTNFNSDVSSWDVSNVTDMRGMFYDCTNFNSDVSNWNVSNVTGMDRMFDYWFKLDIPSWYKN